jgi:hypothetical protein
MGCSQRVELDAVYTASDRAVPQLSGNAAHIAAANVDTAAAGQSEQADQNYTLRKVARP